MSMAEFLAEMKRTVPSGARVMLCQFRGDPYAEQRGKWRARVINDVDMIDEQANVYLCVSAMQRNARGEFRRRKENFAGGLLLMIDDIGTGPGSKFPMEILEPLPPTALIETSPRNFQAVYFFRQAITSLPTFDALIRAFIRKQFLSKDTGMAGVNRVFRPPAGINGKPKYRGWRVRLTAWNPERRYSVEEIVRAFGLTLTEERRAPRGATVDRAGTIRAFIATRAALRSAGMLKSERADVAGWIPVRCPWTEDHTGGADNGAGIREPDEENGWTGGFRCHHGHCDGKGWRELTDWLNEELVELLGLINRNAPKFDELNFNAHPSRGAK
jgi:hypothetical protein